MIARLLAPLRGAVRRYRQERAERLARGLRKSIAYIERTLRSSGLTEDEEEELRDLLSQQRTLLAKLRD